MLKGDDLALGEPVVGELHDSGGRLAVAMSSRPLLDGVAAREGRAVLGDPGGAEQPQRDAGQLVVGGSLGLVAVDTLASSAAPRPLAAIRSRSSRAMSWPSTT